MKSTISLQDLRARTPIVDNIISLLPSGLHDDKALKYAFYNVVALILAGLSVLAVIAVYCILEPFIKPLLWALLFGSVLYPFKRKVVAFTKGWIEDANQSSVPFTVHLISSPLVVVDGISERIGDYVSTSWKSIVGSLAAFFVTYIFYYNPPVTLGLALKWILTTSFSVSYWILGCVRGEFIFALFVAYSGLIVHAMIDRKREYAATLEAAGSKSESQDVPDKSPSSSPTTTQISEWEIMALKVLSTVTWTLSFLYLCRRLPYSLLVPFLLCMIAGSVAYFRQRYKQVTENSTIPNISMLATKLVFAIGKTPKLTRSQSIDIGRSSPVTSPFSPSTPKLRGSLRETLLTQKLRDEAQGDTPQENVDSSVFEDEVDYPLIESNKFLYGVFLACLAVQVWNHLLNSVIIFGLLGVYYGIKKACFKLGIIEFVEKSVRDRLLEFYSNDKDELSGNVFPMPVRTLIRVMSSADKKFCEFCEAYLDPVASSVIVVAVLLLTVLFFVFSATQIYLEGDHLVRVSIDLINTTVSQHPEINQVLPEGWENMLGQFVDNAYIHGKEYITNTIRDSIEEKDPEKAREIEKQVIELWDKVYLSWNKTWDGAYNSSTKVISAEEGNKSETGIEWNELLERGKNVQLFEYSVLVDYAKENLGTVIALLESVWTIVIGNVSIAVSALTSVLSVVLGGGNAIVSFMINLVIFFTALFYLLNSSTSDYKPVEFFRTSIPGDKKLGNRFLCAVEDAINGVFTASAKMALFYGLWTFLIHSLFQINIVFVPSLLAAVFGAVPLVMPYWAALPAILELIIIQGQYTLAVLMMLAQMAPMSMVDTQIYSEIKGGGHPYLTGLSVAGGIFYFGMQGAIIGPVVLCILVIFVKMGAGFLNDQEEEPDASHSHPLTQQFRSHLPSNVDSTTSTPEQ